MKTFVRIQHDQVAELLRTEGDITGMFNPALVWIDVSPRVDIAQGWHFDGVEFAPPPAPPPPSPPASPAATIADLQEQLTLLSAQLATLSSKG
ncbi:MAG: hypothetical protein WDN25_09250 [Acetobacteraceae bacterium]